MKKIVARIYLLIIFVVLYLPIFYLMFFAFNQGGDMNHFQGFTLEYFRQFFADQRLVLILCQTFLLAFLSALIATLIGTFGSLSLFYLRHQGLKNLFLSLNNILMVSADVIIGASFLILFTALGFQLGFFSVLLSHIAFSIPIVVLMVLPKLREMKLSLIDAATDLGATPRQVLTKIIFPYLTNGIIAGFFMAFTYSLDDFAVTFFVTGNGFTTLSVEIYSRARRGVSLEINALSTLVFLVSLLLVIGYYYIIQENTKNLDQKKKKYFKIKL